MIVLLAWWVFVLFIFSPLLTIVQCSTLIFGTFLKKSTSSPPKCSRCPTIYIAHHDSCHFRGAYLPLQTAGVSKPASCASRCSARRFFRLLQYLPCLGLVGSHRNGRSIQELVANSRQKKTYDAVMHPKVFGQEHGGRSYWSPCPGISHTCTI